VNQKLLCYAFGRDGSWEAICIDFDLAVHGKSFKDVQDQLSQITKSYLEDAMKEEPETAKRLMSRRVPFLTRARLAVLLFWRLMTGAGSERGNYYAGYDMPCPA
jgi:hypothetical protein